MKRTTRAKPQTTLALPIEAWARNEELEAAVRFAEASFLAKSTARAAEQLVDANRATGADAVQHTAAVDPGNYDEPVILARYGRLPEGFERPI